MTTPHLHKRTRINPVSKKRAALNVERRAFVADFLYEHPDCQIQSAVCTRRAIDVHEPLTRARGGSITDPNNALAVCRLCHDYCHAHPAESARKGWLKSRYTQP